MVIKNLFQKPQVISSKARRAWALFFFILFSVQCSSLKKSEDKTAETKIPKNSSIKAQDKHLIFALDGVPHHTMVALREKGFFKGFNPPVKVVSTFPSITSIGFTAALGSGRIDGYEAVYFNREKQSLDGGLWKYISKGSKKSDDSYLRFFDYHRHRFHDSYAYGMPKFSARTEVESLLESPSFKEFLKTDKKTFIAYLLSTDPLAHMDGELMLEKFLKKLDQEMKALKQKIPLRISLFSDHGNHFRRKWNYVNLEQLLKNKGYELSEYLEESSPKKVVSPQMGLVGFSSFYPLDSEIKNLSKQLITDPRIELVTWSTQKPEQRNRIHLYRMRNTQLEKALITKTKSGYAYEALEGDPLDYAPIKNRILAEKRRTLLTNQNPKSSPGSESSSNDQIRATQSAPDREDFGIQQDLEITQNEWFNHSVRHHFPNALERIFQGHSQKWIKNPAPILVSYQNGYYSGSRGMSLVASQVATHGNLRAKSTNGFWMSNQQTGDRVPNKQASARAIPIQEIEKLLKSK